jgi:hypothetical protein
MTALENGAHGASDVQVLEVWTRSKIASARAVPISGNESRSTVCNTRQIMDFPLLVWLLFLRKK